MDNLIVLILAGFIVGTLGTLIGAGGGFILVPILLFTHPEMKPEIVTAISMAIVACNAISGTVAYAAAGRIDYRAGLLFALITIPGSIVGALATKYIPKNIFDIVFGFILCALAIYLFVRHAPVQQLPGESAAGAGWKHQVLIDRSGQVFDYRYNTYLGLLISVFVGFISPVLGIGGGIIHVPALVNWLRFPVYVATATSHFILAVMSVVSVIVHFREGNYHEPLVMKIVTGLAIGVVVGAQLGAFLSHRLKSSLIIRALAVSLGLVGLRILVASIG